VDFEMNGFEFIENRPSVQQEMEQMIENRGICQQ